MSQPYIGEIRMGGWNFAPAGWALCNGALQAIDQNPALFNLIGTTYGGDGQSTFALPDLQGRVPIHQGTGGGGTYAIGEQAGVETVTLTSQQIPSHTHGLQASTGASTSTVPTGLTFAASSVNVYVSPTAAVTTKAASTSTGGSQPHDNFMPYLCITFVISLFGIFPSQN